MPAKEGTLVTTCPVCGYEAWPLVYGMVSSRAREENLKTEFAGCVVLVERSVDPSTGEVLSGRPKWACQNVGCRYRWW